MNLGMVRAVNSSAIRLWQLKKAVEYYREKCDSIVDQDFYLFMADSIQTELNDLEQELREIHNSNKWDKYSKT